MLAIKLVNLVLCLDQGLQKLWNLSALESVVHLRELVELEFLKLVEVLVALSRLNDVDIGFNEVVKKSVFLINLWNKSEFR